MKMTHNVNLEQQQKLLLTPELRQAIAVLQMSSMELEEYIQQELEENPVLELREDETEDRMEEPELEEDEADWWEYFLDRSDLGYTENVDEGKKAPWDSRLTAGPTLHEHLEFQLHISLTDEEDLGIGRYLIGCIDENGYLRITLEEAAEELGVAVEKVNEVLRVIQTFEPYGVGARDLAECLIIQLYQTGRLTSLLEKVIRNYLEDIAKGRLAKIAAALNLTVVEVQDIADLIRSLDPKPGRQYGSAEDVRYLVPDVTVEKINNEWVVWVNDISSSRLTISPLYRDILRHPQTFGKETQKYLEERINSALWLIKSIDHRRMTLYKVAKCIVEIQKDFLEKGIKYLKPLNLKKVAEMIGVHESTISRATAQKYMQTPQGVFEMKFFFCGGVESAAGDEKYSSRSIKKMIQEMVEKEDAKNPLSDQQIAEMLGRKGIQISRRTVAKYRTELGIAAASARKRY